MRSQIISTVVAALVGIAMTGNSDEAKAFNPQPDPPKLQKIDPGEKTKTLNPQVDASKQKAKKAGNAGNAGNVKNADNAGNAKKLNPKQKALGGPDTAPAKQP
jgi:hypothetical protein